MSDVFLPAHSPSIVDFGNKTEEIPMVIKLYTQADLTVLITK